MDNLIALRVTFREGEPRFFLTWGRIQDPVDAGPVERLVQRYVEAQSPGGRTRAVESVRLCDSLSEAAGSPYFYEGFFHFASDTIPVGDAYESWVDKRRRIMEKGGEIYDCGTTLRR